jgi:hypothetical protein
MPQPALDALLRADLSDVAARLDLADALAALGRHLEAHLCRDFRDEVRVEGGHVVLA